MKPTLARIAKAFNVDPALVLDTRIRNQPPLLFARAAFMAFHQKNGTPFKDVAAKHGLGIATPYRWLLLHRQYVSGNPVYAEKFAELAGEAA